MTKLNETQTVIITKALTNDRFILSHEKSGSTTDPRAYGSAIASLIKQGLAIIVASPFNVKDGHYVKDGRRVRISDAGLDALEAMHEGPAKAAKPTKAITVAVADVDASITKVDLYTTDGELAKKGLTVAKAAKIMDLDTVEVQWALDDSGRCDGDEYVAVPAGADFPVDDEDMIDEEDEEEARPGTIVKEGYKAYYASLKAEGGSGYDNNDELAKWFRTSFTVTFRDEGNGPGKKAKVRKGMDVSALWAFCDENGIRWSGYVGLNNGQKSMNVRNVVRAMIKNGKDIYCNGQMVFKGKRQETAKEAA